MADTSGGNGGPDIELTRTFEAPRKEVWREWTEPERFADWHGGVSGEVPVWNVSMGVPPGGGGSRGMGAQGGEMPLGGEYREGEEAERLVFTVTDQPDGDIYDTCTVVLSEIEEDRTEMVFQQSGGGQSPPGCWARPGGDRRAAEGWTGFFDRMAERLAGR